MAQNDVAQTESIAEITALKSTPLYRPSVPPGQVVVDDRFVTDRSKSLADMAADIASAPRNQYFHVRFIGSLVSYSRSKERKLEQIGTDYDRITKSYRSLRINSSFVLFPKERWPLSMRPVPFENTGDPLLARYKGRSSAKSIERDYPHIVEIAVPLGGLGNRLDRMHDWHIARGVKSQRGTGRYAEPVHYIRWCFAAPEIADAFAAEFEGVRLNPVHQRTAGVQDTSRF